MGTHSERNNRLMKTMLFGVTLALFFLCAAGYVYAQTPASLPAVEQLTEEQAYYKQLTYAANEMNNQLTRWREADSQALSRLQKDQAYVEALIGALRQPPEELIVAQRIVDELYLAYLNVYRSLREGNGASFGEADEKFQLFLDNAAIIKMLNQYQGLNIICH